MATIRQAVSTLIFANRCGDNLLNKALTFDAPFSATVVSGTGVANTSTDVVYSGGRSLYVNNLSTTDPLIINGGSAWYNDFTGSYVLGEETLFQFSIFNSMGSPNVATGRFRVFYEALEVYTIEFETTLFGAWETFFVNLPLYQNYDFRFELDNDPSEAEATEIYLDGIKLEIDDKNINMPTPYTTYVPKEFNLTETIDVPSISGNDFEIVTVTFTGAKVGDLVNIVSFPDELNTLGLIISNVKVTADDEIKFIISNVSGGAHNPASGNYSFKIVR